PALTTGPVDLRFFSVGNGNGTTTFNLPDDRGRVASGVSVSDFGSSSGLGGKVGALSLVISVNQMPQHSHFLITPSGGPGPTPVIAVGTSDAPVTSEYSTQNTGGNLPISLVQPTINRNKIIRYR